MIWSHRTGTTAPVAGPHGGRGGSGRDERGAILILVAICSTVLLVSVAFTVDLGRISTTRRDLQKVADAVALDVSRRLDGRTRSEVTSTAQATFAASLDRNGVDIEAATLDLGWWDPLTEAWTSATAGEIPTAARVEIAESIDYLFAPGGTTTDRAGIASQRASADFCLGSFATRISTADSPVLSGLLGGILGTSVDLVGYRGIVGGSVSIDALATELGAAVGTREELLDTTVAMQDFVLAMAQALDDGGDLARATLLRQVALGLPNPDELVRLGDILEIGNGGMDAALLASLDAFELLTTSALVVNGDSFIDIPGLDLGVPGVAAVTARVSVVERPRCIVAGAIGDGAETAVVRVEIANDLGVLGIVDTSLTLALQTATGTARITAIDCGPPKRLRLGMTTSAVRTDLTFDLEVLNLLGPPLARLQLQATTSNEATTRTFDRFFPEAVFGVTYQVPTPGLNLGAVTLNVPNIPLVNTLVSGTLRPVLTALDTIVLTPLLQSLGVTVAGADITPVGVSCSGPQLVG